MNRNGFSISVDLIQTTRSEGKARQASRPLSLDLRAQVWLPFLRAARNRQERDGARQRAGTAGRREAAVEICEGQPALDPCRLVFIDETWVSTNMARRYDRCARGERLRAGIPQARCKTTTQDRSNLASAGCPRQAEAYQPGLEDVANLFPAVPSATLPIDRFG